MKVAMYQRISSTTNADGDSLDRQTHAIATYANANGMDIVVKKSDIGVQGSEHIFERDGFRKLFDYCKKEDIKTILCENASRFARDVMTQELGYRELKKHGIRVIPVDSPDYFVLENDDPITNLIRQVLGAISEFEKNSIVIKLRGARQRSRLKSGKITLKGEPKCEGRKSLKEIYGPIRYRKLIKKVKNLSDKGLSLAEVAVALAEKGWVQPNKLKPFHRMQIMRFKKEGEV